MPRTYLLPATSVLCVVKYWTQKARVRYIDTHGFAPSPARPRPRQPALHPPDDGARGIVHGGARVGPDRRRGDRARRRGSRGTTADARAVARHLAGRSHRGARDRRVDDGAQSLRSGRPHPVGTRPALLAQLPHADGRGGPADGGVVPRRSDRKSTRLNSSHGYISYAVFCLKKKKRDRAYAT